MSWIDPIGLMDLILFSYGHNLKKKLKDKSCGLLDFLEQLQLKWLLLFEYIYWH